MGVPKILLRKGLLEVDNIQEISPFKKKTEKSLKSIADIKKKILEGAQKKNSKGNTYIDFTGITGENKELPSANFGIRVLDKQKEGQISESLPFTPIFPEKYLSFRYYPLSNSIYNYYTLDNQNTKKMIDNSFLTTASGPLKKVILGKNQYEDGAIISKAVSAEISHVDSKIKEVISEETSNLLKINKSIEIIKNNVSLEIGAFANIINDPYCMKITPNLSATDASIIIPIDIKVAGWYTFSAYVKSLGPEKVSIKIYKEDGTGLESKNFSLSSSWDQIYYSRNLEATKYKIEIIYPAIFASTKSVTLKVAGVQLENGVEYSYYENKAAKLNKEYHPIFFNLPLSKSNEWVFKYSRKIPINSDKSKYDSPKKTYSHFDQLGNIIWGYENGVHKVYVINEGTLEEISPLSTSALLMDTRKKEDNCWEQVTVLFKKVLDAEYEMDISINYDPASNLVRNNLNYQIPIKFSESPSAITIYDKFSPEIEGVRYNLILGGTITKLSENSWKYKGYEGAYKDLYFLDKISFSTGKIFKTVLSVDLQQKDNVLTNPTFRIENIREV